MMKEGDGKVVVVTGGTSGIGRETAVLFAKKGARVVVAGRREKEGEETVELVRRAGGDGIFFKTDVSRASDVQALIGKTAETYGRLDWAFNNAGIEGAWAAITDQTEQEWDRTIDINLKGVWLCLKFEIEQMVRQGTGGAIVNNSSIAGLIGTRGTAIYSASKHGVLGLTKALAIEWAQSGIRINAVCPAVIETPMADRLYARPEVNQWALGLHPLGRFGKAAEVAEAVVWMCSDAASYVTGQAMVIDGGFLAGPNPPQE
jgi:NAD(P)-dependent dehydrogenase (short-subunit alcohol dehydrogenase family)